MKRHGCLIGAICCIVSPILFFVGILASVYPGSILEGPVNWFIFWLFTVLSITLFITGIVFGIVFASKASLEKERKAIKKVIEGKGAGETFSYITNECPYCKSSTIEGGIIYRASNDEERKTLGFKTKWQRACLKCMAKWVELEK